MRHLRPHLHLTVRACVLLCSTLAGSLCATTSLTAQLAWDKDCPRGSMQQEIPAAVRDSLPASIYPGRTTEKDRWARAARTVPGGFGGLTAHGTGVMISLVDTTKRIDATNALVADGILQPQQARTAAVRKVRWTFAQLYYWYQYLNLHVELGKDVTARVIDEGENRIYYSARGAKELQALQNALSRLHVPCFLVWADTLGTVR